MRLYCESVSRRSWAFDIAIAVVVAALGAAEAIWGFNATHRQGPVAAEAAVYVVTGLLLVLRRVTPIRCLAAITVASAIEFSIFGSPEGMGVAFPGTIGAYSVGRYVDRRRSWWGLVLVAVLWTAWSVFDPVVTTPLLRLEQLGWMSPWVVAWLVGALVRSQTLHAAQRRVVRAEREARAVVEERNRIARELHDVLGHSVSVMTVQASAVRRRLGPDQVEERRALETVEAVGREALDEMRRMVGMLRQSDDGADRVPTPGTGQLDDLVEKFRVAGLPVRLHRTGIGRELPGGLDLTVYRIVQEGLTNALRHAVAPGAVEVELAYGDGAVEVRVRDDGRAADDAAEPDPAVGHGLLGMRERVALYGGTLRAGPRDGGFVLAARLPISADEDGADEGGADEGRADEGGAREGGADAIDRTTPA